MFHFSKILILESDFIFAPYGTKIDSSYDRGKAFEFTVGKGQVIRGWDEGIQKVTLGSKVRLTISPVRCLVMI